MDDDRAAALAEAYKRNILPPAMKAAYEEATKRGLVGASGEKKDAPAAPAKTGYAKMLDDQRGEGRWDVLGDIGRAASGAAKGIGEGFSQAFPSREEIKAKDAASTEKYGPVAGPVMDTLTSSPAAGLAKIPLSALGVAGSPITGALHSTLGSALSYIPGVDKKGADDAIDQSLSLLAPETRGLGAVRGGQAAAAQNAATSRAAQVKSLAANAQAAAKDPSLVQARQAGYVLHPADAVQKPGPIADTLSGLGGKIKTQQEASARNQEVTNRLAATELGLPADAVLDDATFAGVRKNAGAAYQKVENAASTLPRGVIQADKDFLHDVNNLDNSGDALRQDFPELGEHPDIAKLQTSIAKNEFSPRGGVEAIKRLRFQSKENFKALGDPSKRQLAEAQREAANAIEELIDRNLKQSGNAAAVDEYRAARQQIAKSHDIEAATDAAGNVDARKLAKMGARRPFTGNLKIIADTADRYPKSMQMPSKFGGVEKRSILDTLTALGSGGAAIGGAFMHNPMVAMSAMPLAIAPFTRPLARSLALSESLQNRLAGLRSPNQFGPMIGQGAVPAVTGPNALRSMLPGAGTPAAAPVAQPQPQGGQ